MSINVSDNSIEKILFLKDMGYSFCVTMDINEDQAMLINFIKDKAYRFKDC